VPKRRKYDDAGLHVSSYPQSPGLACSAGAHSYRDAGMLSNGTLITIGFDNGCDTMMQAFTPTGTLDQAFGSQGYVFDGPIIYNALNCDVDRNDRLLVAGGGGLGFWLARYLTDTAATYNNVSISSSTDAPKPLWVFPNPISTDQNKLIFTSPVSPRSAHLVNSDGRLVGSLRCAESGVGGYTTSLPSDVEPGYYLVLLDLGSAGERAIPLVVID
jgi:hypothetical protein